MWSGGHIKLPCQGDLLRVKKLNFGWSLDVDNFLIDIEYDPVYNSYLACYSNGTVIQLGANTYQDAVLEADTIEPYDYQGA